MYEFKVVPAPKRGIKGKGVKGNEGRFAHALETVMNDLGRQGWDYVRTDTLPSEEREGLMGRTTVFQNMLVFRRALPVSVEPTDVELEEEPKLIEDKTESAPEPEPVESAETQDTEPTSTDAQTNEDAPSFRPEPRLVSDD